MDPLKPQVPPSFESERLDFRHYTPDDASLFYQVITQNREHLKMSLPPFVLNIQSPEEAKELIMNLIEDRKAYKRFIYGAWNKANNEYIAELYLTPTHWGIPMAEIGYHVVQEHQGKGFVSEAVKAFIPFCFEHLKLEKLFLECDIENTKSSSLAERCGFLKEGILRKESKRADGDLTDKVHYGMTRQDLEGLYKDIQLK